MNEYDSNRILDLFKSIGYSRTENLSETNCYVLNTCHIREKATNKVYDDVGRLKKKFKDKKKPILLIAGCVAQAEGDEMLKRESFIDGVIGPQSYHKIPRIIKKIEIEKNRVNSTEFNVIEKFDNLNLIQHKKSKISSFLTIQEGCDKFCHFCVVPYTRGPEHSRSYEEIMFEAKQLVDKGAKEIILLGQNVNAYNFKNFLLSDLINELNEMKGLERIRYTTSHPKDMTNDLIDVYQNCEKLMPLVHLPVQSGSSKILKLMNRKHDIEEYWDTIKRLKEKKPSIKFSSDFIIGYPGETEEDFCCSLDLMEKIGFINSYSYIFSPRPGTPSAELKCIDREIAKKRLIVFQKKSNEIIQNYRKTLLNKKIEVLFENRSKEEKKYFGRDKHSNAVVVKSDYDLTGKTFNVKVKKFNQHTLFGEIAL